MFEANLDCSQLELSKENIQPIRQGRKASSLSNALDKEHQNKLQSERHEFEKEIRAYSGDDPLDVWYRYVLWVEQNYPKGGVQGNLFKLIESCFKTLCCNGEFEEKYKNDERFLNLWSKYATLSPCPLEIYQTLYSKNIFTKLAKFYIIWAWELEQCANLKKANLIYLDGCDRKAQPLDSLEIAYGKFQARVAQRALEGLSPEKDENSEDKQRKIFASLKAKGSKARAPSERVATIIGTAGKFLSTCPKTNVLGPSFRIFQDENTNEDQMLHKKSEKIDCAFTSVTTSTKENTKNPSVWNKNSIKQKHIPMISVEDVNRVNTPSFTVHSDLVETKPQAVTTNVTEFSGVLSARKNQDEWKVPLFIQEPFNPYAQPQYSKHRVYCGNEEFSFEELMALDRQKKEEFTKKAERNCILEGQVRELQMQLKKQEEMIKSLLQKQNTSENSSREEMKSLQYGNMKSDDDDDDEKIGICNRVDSQSKKVYEDSWVAINKSVSFAANTTQNVCDESSTKALLDLQTVIPNDLLTVPHQNNFSSGCSPPNNTSVSREVTANTKYANNVVLELFSATLSNNTMTNDEILPVLCKESTDSGKEDKIVSSEPFQIYEDKKDFDCPMPIPKSEYCVLPFPIHYDENEEPVNVAQSTKENGSSNGVSTNDEKTKCEINNKEICDNNVPFTIFSDENEHIESVKKQIAKLSPLKPLKPLMHYDDTYKRETGVFKDASLKYENENQENIPPSNYQIEKTKRPIVGILKPSLSVPFIPLEQKNDTEDADDGNDDFEGLDGIEPLPENNEDNFTMKIPVDPEAFVRNSFVASTPAPWSISVVPQVKQGDDFTMAIPRRESALLEPSPDRKNLTEKLNVSGSELMPPPPNIETPSPNTSQNQIQSRSQSAKYLSPILEASRENRSFSSSSSSGSCTTSTIHSNIGIPGNTSKSGNFSQLKSFSGREVAKNEEEENDYFNNSFDPNKISAMLLSENPLTDSKRDEIQTKPKELTRSLVKEDKRICSLLSTDIQYPADIDPFSNDLRNLLLQNLKESVSSKAGFISINNKMPAIKARSKMNLGKEMYNIKRMIGSGSYAQVFHASTIDPMNVTVAIQASYESGGDDDDENEESQMIMKVQKPQCQWEFYICYELRERLKKLKAPEKILNSFMRINRGYFFPQGSILVSQFHKNGTIIDLINKYKKTGNTIQEILIVFIMREIILMVNYLHSCGIIHGDLKPDNVLIVSLSQESSESDSPIVKLIDFGRSIDMNLLPSNATFTKKVLTDGFTCIEMKENRPWTYQTDFYGLAAIAHCLIWGSYMNVKKESGVWKISGVNYQRYMDKKFWQDFFHKMLNIPSCLDLPDLKDILRDFDEKLDSFDIFGSGILQSCEGILRQ